jgi:hypothetical protein
MRERFATRVLFLSILLFAVSGVALADSVNLTNVGLTAGGSNGLSLNGPGVNLQVPFNPPNFPDVNYTGLTSITVPINSITLGSGQLVLGGTDYAGYLLSGSATFTIDLTNPIVTPDKFFASDTRTFTGTLAVIDPKTGLTVVNLDFEFTAKVVVTLTGDPCGCYYISSIITQGGRGKLTFTKNDAPVPEPATLLLLGSGLAAIGVRIRKKKSLPS